MLLRFTAHDLDKDHRGRNGFLMQLLARYEAILVTVHQIPTLARCQSGPIQPKYWFTPASDQAAGVRWRKAEIGSTGNAGTGPFCTTRKSKFPGPHPRGRVFRSIGLCESPNHIVLFIKWRVNISSPRERGADTIAIHQFSYRCLPVVSSLFCCQGNTPLFK